MFVRVCLLLLALGTCATPAAARIAVSYRALVDLSQMVRSGQKLGEVLAARPLTASGRGMVQPFLDGYSALLPQAVDMLEGPPAQPFHNVADLFAPGDSQPAWAAICRAGRLRVEADNAGRVRVFAPGDEPRAAYRAHYPVLRHVLAALAAGLHTGTGDSTLSVRVYAYRHDYAGAEFSLQTRPHAFRAAAFPPPPGRTALDIAALAEFFRKGAVLTGATVEPRAGLILEGEGGGANEMMLSGQPVALADFAVAYRAVFHAGDNAAFISLDPHPDPTLATVNFGGLMEHTRIGATVLEADKRFKMIGTGLDPNNFADVRAVARQYHPGFLTSAERDLAAQSLAGGSWVGTRFWFYPESVEIETDPGYRSATIVSARFTADAERQRGDFSDYRAFDRYKKTTLSPGIRDCINDLNGHYEQYAAAFPELRELKAVARLMGICSWLKRGGGATLDLDALLAVELPPFSTPSAKRQMLAANWAARPRSGPADTNSLSVRMVVDYLTPALDEPASRFFSDSAALAACLPSQRGRDGNWPADGLRPMREFIKTTQDLQAFTIYAAEQHAPDMLRRSVATDPAIAAGFSEIQSLAEALRAPATAAGEEEQVRRADLARRYQAAVDGTNALVSQRYAGGVGSLRIISIGGGINLGPDDFRIRVRPRPQARQPGPGPTGRPATVTSRPPAPATAGASSRPPSGRVAAVAAPPAAPLIMPRAAAATRSETRSVAAGAAAAAPGRNSWSDSVSIPGGNARERSYNAAARTLTVTEKANGAIRRIQGRLAGNRIDFTRP